MARVQFIAYQLQTAASGDMARQDYPGLVDQKRDIEARCKILMDAVDATVTNSKVDSTAKKIFAAPEFFFRGGRGGVYDVENLSYLSETMDTYLSVDKYARWTFVLGTALAAMPVSGGRTEILNVALIRRGGARLTGTRARSDESNVLSVGSSETRLVYKEYVSAIDFLGPHFGDAATFLGAGAGAAQANVRGATGTLMPTSGARPTGGVAHTAMANLYNQVHHWTPSVKLRVELASRVAAGNMTREEMVRITTPVTFTPSEESRSGLGGGCRFTMDGLEYTVEICLDHLKQRAAGLTPADIHLVTSCGMTPKYGNLKVNGLFFQVDGISDSEDRAWALQYTGAGFNPFEPIATINMASQRRWNRWVGEGTNLFQEGRGQVLVFPVMQSP
ncbi:hypothetical protein [Hyalangium versicolor]|uniref:hypothetical protein n=1 Tax=Hyalangium versicolor TaxID=2861190 RepID=UPI001CC9DF87|nr:hypothetical protein [Hyalangium versicolor]